MLFRSHFRHQISALFLACLFSGIFVDSLRSARARRPAYTLLVFSTPDLSLLLYRGTGPRDPIRGPRAPRAPSAPLGGWAHGALGGYSEAIPNGKPFQMEVTVPRVTMKVNHSDMKAVAHGSWNDAHIKVLKRVSALEHARACKKIGRAHV